MFAVVVVVVVFVVIVVVVVTVVVVVLVVVVVVVIVVVIVVDFVVVVVMIAVVVVVVIVVSVAFVVVFATDLSADAEQSHQRSLLFHRRVFPQPCPICSLIITWVGFRIRQTFKFFVAGIKKSTRGRKVSY